jgi:hypothetical protein
MNSAQSSIEVDKEIGEFTNSNYSGTFFKNVKKELGRTGFATSD